jgi:hypothetical protein
MAWRPLVESAREREQIAELVRDIAAAVDTFHDAGHATGDDHADRAVLRAYLSRDATLDDPADAMTTSLVAALDRAGEGGLGLYGGLTRTAWTVAHLTGGDQADEVCIAIEQTLLRALAGDTAEFELVNGLAGFGILALERRNAQLATRIVDHLERLARPTKDGLAWHTPTSLLPAWQRAAAPDGYWNLGVAHGIPGVLAVLSRFVSAGLETARAARLVDGCVAFLLAATPPRDGNRYPAWLPAPDDQPCRVGWCYGDLGVAFALLAAADARARDDWRASALDLARGMARRPFPDASIVDAGLCHGSAGAAHLFHRLYRATGDHEFATTARAWLDRTLAIRRSDDLAGFPAFDHQAQCFRPAADLLGGAPGVALALHAMISEIEPVWDRLLVADLATR